MKIYKKIIYIILASFLVIGCCTPKEIIREVPVEVIKEVEKKVFVHDSTFIHDSTIIYQKGDTVFKEKIKYIYMEKQVHDTLATHDTIDRPVYIPQEKIVNKPQWWPVWLFCGFILMCIVLFILINNKFKFTKKWKLMQQK